MTATPVAEPQTSDIANAKTVQVYVCPTPGCTSYYGSPTMGDLGKAFTGPNIVEKPNHQKMTGSPYRHTRAACPDCRAHGKEVERVLMKISVIVPTIGPDTPELPKDIVGLDRTR
jgi:hypothetical protein